MGDSPISLAQIWEASLPELQTVLTSQGYDLPEGSEKLNYYRAIVAMIYYNSGNLIDPNQVWVTHPHFLEVMASAPGLDTGLNTLKLSASIAIATLVGSMAIAGSVSGDAAEVYDAGPIARIASGNYPLNTSVTASTIEAVIREVIGTVADKGARQAALTDWRQPESVPQTVGLAAANASWRVITGFDSQIRASLAALPFKVNQYDPIGMMGILLRFARLPTMAPIARCFYVYSLWDILHNALPPNAEFSSQVDSLITQYGCSTLFNEVITVTADRLSPVLGQIGAAGGRAGLSELIIGYTNRPPTREEVMQRLLALF